MAARAASVSSKGTQSLFTPAQRGLCEHKWSSNIGVATLEANSSGMHVISLSSDTSSGLPNTLQRLSFVMFHELNNTNPNFD
mmetsp:Transcript_26541/g.32560  ORF Transcript_26541/g.32560 Transcript_26541/m.32560 type:complete len:82 (-) Transcript_26541:1736-1981(-)